MQHRQFRHHRPWQDHASVLPPQAVRHLRGSLECWGAHHGFQFLKFERGITILTEYCAIDFGIVRIGMVDTRGQINISGKVERVLSMVDDVLLVASSLAEESGVALLPVKDEPIRRGGNCQVLHGWIAAASQP